LCYSSHLEALEFKHVYMILHVLKSRRLLSRHACRLSAAHSPGRKNSLAGAGWVEVPLKEVISRRRISGSWNLNDVDEGKIDMELLWLPILEGAS